MEHLRRAILERLPSFLGLGLEVRGLSGLNLRVEIIASLFHSGFEIPAHGGEDVIEELAGSSDDLLDVVRIVDLLLLEVRVVLLDTGPDFAFLHGGGVDDQPGGVGDDFLKVGDGGRVCE